MPSTTGKADADIQLPSSSISLFSIHVSPELLSPENSEGEKFTSYQLKLNGSQANPPSLDLSKHFLKPLCSPGLTVPRSPDLLTVLKDFMAVSAVGHHRKGSGCTAGSGLRVCSSPKFTATLILFQAARASYGPNGSLSLAFFKGQEILSAWQMDWGRSRGVSGFVT